MHPESQIYLPPGLFGKKKKEKRKKIYLTQLQYLMKKLASQPTMSSTGFITLKFQPLHFWRCKDSQLLMLLKSFTVF